MVNSGTARSASARGRVRRARGGALAATALVAGLTLGACGTGAGTTAPAAPTAPGAALRSLDRLALHGERTTFEATYRVAFPTSSGVRVMRLVVGRRGPTWRLQLGGIVVLQVPGGQEYRCRGIECVAEDARAPLPSLLGASNPPLASVSLYDGALFWSSTQGYPVTAPDLSRRGVRVRIATATLAGLPVRCVSIASLSMRRVSRAAVGPGAPTRVVRVQRWCLDDQGVVALWRVGRHGVTLLALTRHPSPAAFSLPPDAKVAIPKGPGI